MREAHPLERAVGIEHYVSETDGVGGRLRDRPGDFRVRERESFDVDLHPVDADTGSYPHLVFRATLRAWDTNDFASALSNALGISRERVSWAGTKDKHAITTQLFSVKLDDGGPDRLPELDGAEIEVLGRAGRPVLFGDLAGNEFAVVVRDAERPGNVDAIAAELRAFAADRVPSGAVSEGERGDEDGDEDAEIDVDTGGDIDADTGGDIDGEIAVPNYFGQQRFGSMRPITHRVGLDIVRGDWEAAAVRYVCESSDREPEATRAAREHVGETRDWQDALDRLPDQLRYERAIAARLAEGAEGPADYREALERLPTNLQGMFVNAAQSYAFNRICSERLDRDLPFGRPVAGDVVCFADDAGLPDPARTQVVDEGRVETVTRHCERGRAFVTAPLVGTDTAFGGGEPAAIARGVLQELDIERADFALPGAFDSEGTRRAIRVATDLTVDREPLTLSFTLPKGSYATVLAREFLKVDPDRLA